MEPAGRMVRLTPAGRRLADHAVTILAALEAARADLDPSAEPAGVVRVAGFATAIRRSLVPVVAALAETHPAVELQVREHEPPEAMALLADDEVDLALVYDYNLAPRAFGRDVVATPLWTAQWHLAVPAGDDPSGADASPDVAAPVRGRGLDRQLARHRRRDGAAGDRGAGRVRPAVHAPRRQPRARPGPDRRRPRRRAPARRRAAARGRPTPRPPRPRGRAALLCRHTPRARRVGAARARHPFDRRAPAIRFQRMDRETRNMLPA